MSLGAGQFSFQTASAAGLSEPGGAIWCNVIGVAKTARQIT